MSVFAAFYSEEGKSRSARLCEAATDMSVCGNAQMHEEACCLCSSQAAGQTLLPWPTMPWLKLGCRQPEQLKGLPPSAEACCSGTKACRSGTSAGKDFSGSLNFDGKLEHLNLFSADLTQITENFQVACCAVLDMRFLTGFHVAR